MSKRKRFAEGDRVEVTDPDDGRTYLGTVAYRYTVEYNAVRYAVVIAELGEDTYHFPADQVRAAPAAPAPPGPPADPGRIQFREFL